MKYKYQKKQSAKVAQRNRNIWLYWWEHKNSSQEDIGRVFHLSGQMVGRILAQEKSRETIRTEIKKALVGNEPKPTV